jgi:FAD/FMN-containing dehydrogenase/Fe-S oxidoreductase
MPDGFRHSSQTLITGQRVGDPKLANRLSRAVEGDVFFDAPSRGRYSTDASIYQIEPIGIVRPKSITDVEAVLKIAAEEGLPVLPRGGGTSQCGQTVAEAIVLDTSTYMNSIYDINTESKTAKVAPGVVLAQLNAQLASEKLFFPVDPSTASRCTIGGMAANNSSGARSIRYGIMADNVLSIDAMLANGSTHHFGWVDGDAENELGKFLQGLAHREQEEINKRVPKVLRHVAGYNLHRIQPPGSGGFNMADILVGSEGTLGFFKEIELKLQPLPAKKAIGICQFPTFRAAMEATQHLVTLDPDAVELVDRTIIERSRAMPAFADIAKIMSPGEPQALLIVEFSGETETELLPRLQDLEVLMGDIGWPNAVVKVTDPLTQRRVWGVREAGLNIVMAMTGDAKPVSVIEDCAIPLEHLADFTDRLTGLFERYDSSGTWYAHASVGLLHVRPILNMKTSEGAAKLRSIAEEAFEIVAEYEGSHSGEHGDGKIRSEFIETMQGPRLARTFEEIKEKFDPADRFNPGNIVRPPKLDDRGLMRFKPGYGARPIQTGLDWSVWGGFLGATEMCNNNGTCRSLQAGVMCPSFKATRDETHVTRGRANTLRLALSGQLGEEDAASAAMSEAMELCVGCKGCRRECPTGVDMARMKIEVAHQELKRGNKPALGDRITSFLPRIAHKLSKLGNILNLRDRIPGLAWISEKTTGLAAQRKLPTWSPDPFKEEVGGSPIGDGLDVVLFADTFTTWFEPEKPRAAVRVLKAAGFRPHVIRGPDGRGPCCGRTFLANGMIDQAREEALRTLDLLEPFLKIGAPVLGLEPACLFTFKDEFVALKLDERVQALGEAAQLIDEFLVSKTTEDFRAKLKNGPKKILVHGHCHQKAFGVAEKTLDALRLIPDAEVSMVESSCCGMAGSFGYQKKNLSVSLAMAELNLLPAVRKADPDTIIVADGTSCRHQIEDGTGRRALHAVEVLANSLR